MNNYSGAKITGKNKAESRPKLRLRLRPGLGALHERVEISKKLQQQVWKVQTFFGISIKFKIQN